MTITYRYVDYANIPQMRFNLFYTIGLHMNRVSLNKRFLNRCSKYFKEYTKQFS